MKAVNIEAINELVGPLWGPNMRQLLAIMREQHGYTAKPIPCEFAKAVNEVLPDGAQVATDQCPEMFAAEAGKALGYVIDMDPVRDESKKFQSRYRFHTER